MSDFNDVILNADFPRITLIASDLSSFTLSSNVTAQDGFPLMNLQTYYSDDRYVSSSTAAGQWISIDLGSDQTCNVLICENHNWASISGSTISFQASSDGLTGWSNVIADISTSGTTSVHSYDDQPSRYWRIVFNGNMTEAPYVGQIFLGKSLIPQFNHDWNYKSENEQYATSEAVMLDGRLRMSSLSDARILYEITLPVQNELFREEFQTFYSTIRGRSIPFYVIDDLKLRYMHLDRDLTDLQVQRFGQNKINTLRMKSQKVGLDAGIAQLHEIRNMFSGWLIITVE